MMFPDKLMSFVIMLPCPRSRKKTISEIDDIFINLEPAQDHYFSLYVVT